MDHPAFTSLLFNLQIKTCKKDFYLSDINIIKPRRIQQKKPNKVKYENSASPLPPGRGVRGLQWRPLRVVRQVRARWVARLGVDI